MGNIATWFLLTFAQQSIEKEAHKKNVANIVDGLYPWYTAQGKNPEQARQSQLGLLLDLYHNYAVLINGLVRIMTADGHPNAFRLAAKEMGTEPDALFNALKGTLMSQQEMYADIARERGIVFPIREERLYLEEEILREIQQTE